MYDNSRFGQAACQLYFSNLSRHTVCMNRSNHTSYEGFRRKNSLNMFDGPPDQSPPDLTFIKAKHKEDLKLVENLSMELEKISKRSVGCRSMGGGNCSLHVFSCEDHNDSKLFGSKNKHTTSLQHLDLELEQEEVQKKVTSLALFNKFDTIEESHSLCEEEFMDEKPATARNPPTKTGQKTLLTKHSLKASLPNPAKKTTAPPKIEPPGVKRERQKHDIVELDKMKKQLESKRFARQHIPGVKPLPDTATAARKPREPPPPQGVAKDVKTARYGTTSNHPKVETSRLVKAIQKPFSSSTSHNNFSEKTSERTTQSKHQFEELKLEMKKTEQVPMIATRMLTEKEKNCLIDRLQQLRDIIQKNQVCGDNLEEINDHMNTIEHLLTR